MLAKSHELRTRLLDTTLVLNLIKLCIIIWNKQESPDLSTPPLIQILYCLLRLGKVFNRRNFTLNVYNDLQSDRNTFLSQGGLYRNIK